MWFISLATVHSLQRNVDLIDSYRKAFNSDKHYCMLSIKRMRLDFQYTTEKQ